VAYQVLARKWRPQRFEDVVGQQAVTTTLRNALSTGRIAHAFIFAGARGVGKTTTARILAKALNCVKGPTPDPCGTCEACVEIAQGRDLDVLEIDAATNTRLQETKDVIINGLAISPARDRYKVFIIDEVHQLSEHSFNALLKSIEEPPPHVVFIMATTELQAIPETIRSRAQEYEFRTISVSAIAAQLRVIAQAEGIQAHDDAIALVARSAEGSMRDAQSALDHVIAFAGQNITSEDVATVLGLVGRDLLFDIVTAVADEDAAAAFALAGRAVDAGHDLRILCRELAEIVRAMMLVSIDAGRVNDPDLALEADRARLGELTARFSREDLLRSFDLLAKAEQDVRIASQPRYALEMALVKWIHLRKLVPIADLIAGLESGPQGAQGARPAPARPGATFGSNPTSGNRSVTPAAKSPSAPPAKPPAAPAATASSPSTSKDPTEPTAKSVSAPAEFKDRFLAEVQRTNRTFYSLHVAQAQRIDVEVDRVVFTFGPVHETMRQQVEQRRGWLEQLAESVAGRKIAVTTVKGTVGAAIAPVAAAAPAAPVAPAGDLKARAMADDGVQALLDVFPAEIRDVEEIK
jgi:DNA polymerase III subunit gamma/tau